MHFGNQVFVLMKLKLSCFGEWMLDRGAFSIKTKFPQWNILLLGGIMGSFCFRHRKPRPDARCKILDCLQVDSDLEHVHWKSLAKTQKLSLKLCNLTVCHEGMSFDRSANGATLLAATPGGWRIDGGLVILATSFLFSLHWTQSTGKTFSLSGHFLEKATRPALNYKAEKQYDAD